MYLQEDVLQLSTVFPRILLAIYHCVCRDAIVRHPVVTLQHPHHDVWKTVLRLRYRHTFDIKVKQSYSHTAKDTVKCNERKLEKNKNMKYE